MTDTVVFAEQTIKLSSRGDYYYTDFSPAPFTLVSGEKYSIVLDGIEYRSVCNSNYEIMYIIEDDNSNPVSGSIHIIYIPESVSGTTGGVLAISIWGKSDTHTLAIYRKENEIIYAVNSTALKAVADAIRAKTGGTEALVFPDGMVEAISGLIADNVTYPLADEPETMGQRACLARAAQMRDITFKPLAPLIGDDETHVMAANNEQQGVWYSSTRGTEWGFIGYAVSMYSLLTALHNPKSIIYTRKYSDYFLKDTGLNGAGNVYGTNCSEYVSYALGLPYLTVTNWLPKLEQFVNENGVHDTGYGGVCWDAANEIVDTVKLQSELKLCDVLNSSGYFKASSYTGTTVGHAVIVTGIRRNRNGLIQEVDISESNWASDNKFGIRVTSYVWADFVAKFIDSEGYRVYRYAGLSSVEAAPTINDIAYSDICTSRGDKISIRPDQDITLNVLNMGDYVGIALFKNGVLTGTRAITADAPDWKLTDLTTGKYVAILYPEGIDPTALTENNANNTNSTSFIVCACTVARNGTTYTYTAEAINGEYPLPMQVIVKKDTGITAHVHLLDEANFNGSNSVSFAMDSSTTSSAAIIHVPFKTEYGFVIAEIGYDGNPLEKPVLPDDEPNGDTPTYQDVEYIGFTGTQYINTGVDASEYGSTPLDYHYKGTHVLPSSGTSYIWGCMTDGCRAGNGFFMGKNTVGMYLGTNSSNYFHGTAPGEDVLYEIEAKNVCSSNPATTSCAVDGVALNLIDPNGSLGTGRITTAGTNIYLLAANINGTIKGMFTGKLYGFSISKSDGTPIRNFVPCYRVSDGVIGLRDTVGGKFYTNAGTGSFTKGADV